MKRKNYLTPRLTVVATDTDLSLLLTISDSVTDQPQLSRRNNWDDEWDDDQGYDLWKTNSENEDDI